MISMIKRVKSWSRGGILLVRFLKRTGGIFWGGESKCVPVHPSCVKLGQGMRLMTSLYRYQRAFVDFLEDQLVYKKYDWKALLAEYLFQGKEPLINGLVSGRE
jgi:hypothetical protein